MRLRASGHRRARTIGRAATVVVAAVAVLAAGCNRGPQTYAKQAQQAQRTAPDKRPWFCNSVGDGTPLSGHGNGSHVHSIYEGKTKAPLSWDDCNKLAAELDKTVQATKGLETKAKGEAAGWRQVAEYIPGLGTHHSKVPAGAMPPGSVPPGSRPPGTAPGGAGTSAIAACLREKGIDVTSGTPNFSDPAFVAALQACGVNIPAGGLPGFGGTFDPANPQFLIYGGPQPDAPLVGAAYAFFGASTPPAAYAGENDWWHLHTKVCIGPNRQVLAGAEEVSDEQCKALGGTNRSIGGIPGASGGPAGGGIWLLHVWMTQPYEYRLDIFASGHNCLLADGVAPKSDPCWQLAQRDPSLGMPPRPEGPDGHGGGGHDGPAGGTGGDHPVSDGGDHHATTPTTGGGAGGGSQGDPGHGDHGDHGN